MLEVTCAIIVQDKKILITQNNANSDHPFQWEFPGGKIKTGESSADCIKREIKEELNIAVDIKVKLKPVDFDYGFRFIKLIPFLCSIKKGEIKLNEHNDFKWIEFSELENIDFSGADLKLIQQEQNLAFLKEYIGK